MRTWDDELGDARPFVQLLVSCVFGRHTNLKCMAKFMWGNDYPHDEGTFPFTREHLRQFFHGAASESHIDTLRVRVRRACTSRGMYRPYVA
jgi:hypothetical protein